MVEKSNGCDCYSYNGGFGTVPTVQLERVVGILPDGEKVYETVSIDACIAEVIDHLWFYGINTLNSCCGHGGHYENVPQIILGEGEDDFERIRKLIKEVDSREFKLMQWKLITL